MGQDYLIMMKAYYVRVSHTPRPRVLVVSDCFKTPVPYQMLIKKASGNIFFSPSCSPDTSIEILIRHFSIYDKCGH